MPSVLFRCGTEFTGESGDILTLPAEGFFQRPSVQSLGCECVCAGFCPNLT